MNLPNTNRRQFLQQAIAGTAAISAANLVSADDKNEPWFKISLAQWSLNRAFFGRSAARLDNLDFARVSREEFGITAIEYVNQMFYDKGKDQKYLAELKKRASDQGVETLLIMVDREGRLGDPDEKKRKEAVEKHYKWVEAAKFLGCHSVRVNAASGGEYDEQVKLAADGLARLSDFAEKFGLNVIVENHGGLSSNGAWLAKVMKTVGKENCGTLPDFGNFRVTKDEWYDRYKGVKELMPFAKAVSAKSYDFDADGNDLKTDFLKMMKIVKDAGYRGYVGIEYEGHTTGQFVGIHKTKRLLERVRDQLA